MAFKRFVYISGALTSTTEEELAVLRSFYERLGEVCAESGLGAYIPHQVSDPLRAKSLTPRDVDRLDREAVTACCLVIAYVGRVSFGVGIEIEMAYHANKPVVLLCERETIDARRLSRLVRGNPAVAREIVFGHHASAIEQLRVFLADFCDAHRSAHVPALLRV